MIGVGVHVYIYVCGPKKLNCTLSDQLTFSNISGRSSLALPLLSPETRSSLSRLEIFLFNAHLALFVQRMTTQLRPLNSIGKYCHLLTLGTI